MQRRGGRARVRMPLAIAALLALPLGGCDSAPAIWVELAQFGGGAIDGVWLWKLSETTGGWDRSCRIELGDPTSDGQGEYVVYVQQCRNEEAFPPARGTLERYASDPGRVRVRFRFQGADRTGMYRMTAYGARGETGLSDTTLQL